MSDFDYTLTQDWNGLKTGASINHLLPYDREALVLGGAATKAPVTKPAAAPVKKIVHDDDTDEKPKTPEEEKAALRADIIELGGLAPHPNTGLETLRQRRDELLAARERERMEEGDGEDG